MQQQTWQIQQQLQRIQQLSSEAVQINQQMVQELQHVNQQVAQLSTVNAANAMPFQQQQQQGGYYGYPGATGINSVMQADRQASIQENSPSYRNYNTQTPQYSPMQSVNYSASASYGSSAPIQSVMMADQQSNTSSSYRPQYGSYSSTMM